jgi:hypothetical protein
MVKMAKKFMTVLMRGAISIIIIPAFFYVLQTFLGGQNVLDMVSKQNATVGFIIIDLLPLTYFVMGIIWTIAPLWAKDEIPQQRYYQPPQGRGWPY